MSVLGTLFGGGVAAPIEAVGNVLDKLFTSDDEKLDKKVILERLAQQPALAQVELNKLEAQHRSVFVAGWRPFIGWVCGFALAWHFVIYDLLNWITINFFPTVTNLPVLSGTDTLLTLVLSLLGLGGMRTFEKMAGKAK